MIPQQPKHTLLVNTYIQSSSASYDRMRTQNKTGQAKVSLVS